MIGFSLVFISDAVVRYKFFFYLLAIVLGLAAGFIITLPSFRDSFSLTFGVSSTLVHAGIFFWSHEYIPQYIRAAYYGLCAFVGLAVGHSVLKNTDLERQAFVDITCWILALCGNALVAYGARLNEFQIQAFYVGVILILDVRIFVKQIGWFHKNEEEKENEEEESDSDDDASSHEALLKRPAQPYIDMTNVEIEKLANSRQFRQWLIKNAPRMEVFKKEI